MDLKHAPVVAAGSTMEGTTAQEDVVVGMVFSALALVCGTLFFWSVQSVIDHAGWVVPVSMATLLIIVLFLGAILVTRRAWRFAVAVLALVPSLFFAPTVWHAVWFVVAMVTLFFSSEKIVLARDNMRKIRVGDAIHTGVLGILVALAMMSSSQYFAAIADRSVDDLMPRMRSAVGLESLITKYFVKNDHGTMVTVDDFLAGVVERQIPAQQDTTQNNAMVTQFLQTAGVEIDPAQAQAMVAAAAPRVTDTVQQNAVEAARQNIATAIGTPLRGTESIVDVLVLFANAQIANAITHSALLRAALPKVLALVLFFTLLSVAAVLRVPWMWLTQLIFVILKALHIVRVRRRHDDVDEIHFT